MRDFTYLGDDIVAGPNTAIRGPVEEFNSEGGPLGYAEAAPGEGFLKIGVGVLRRRSEAEEVGGHRGGHPLDVLGEEHRRQHGDELSLRSPPV